MMIHMGNGAESPTADGAARFAGPGLRPSAYGTPASGRPAPDAARRDRHPADRQARSRTRRRSVRGSSSALPQRGRAGSVRRSRARPAESVDGGVAHLHPGQAGQFGGLVDEVAIRREDGHFLEGDDIRVERGDDHRRSAPDGRGLTCRHQAGGKGSPGPIAARMFQVATRRAARVRRHPLAT